MLGGYTVFPCCQLWVLRQHHKLNSGNPASVLLWQYNYEVPAPTAVWAASLSPCWGPRSLQGAIEKAIIITSEETHILLYPLLIMFFIAVKTGNFKIQLVGNIMFERLSRETWFLQRGGVAFSHPLMCFFFLWDGRDSLWSTAGCLLHKSHKQLWDLHIA